MRTRGQVLGTGSPGRRLSGLAQLAGAALLVGTGLLGLFGGSASGQPAPGTEVPGSAVPIGSFTAGTPFSSGQVISIQIPANPTLSPGAGIFIVECAAPGGVVPTDPSQCDGKTIQGDTILAGTDGSVDYTVSNTTSGYTVYALPNATSLGEPPTQTPVCNLSNECVLYIGQNQNDFTQPHFWSQPFYVAPTTGDTGANPGDGSAPPAATTPDAGTSTVTAAAVPPSPVADGKDPATVTVRLLDSSSVPVPGKTVTLTAGSGSSVITPTSAVSAADGTAVFTVTDATPETVVYTAEDTTDSTTVTATASVVFAAPVVTPANSTVVASPTQVAADGVTASTITVTLRDQGAGIGYAVPGKAITLTPSGGSSVVTPATATTDSSGVATFSAVDSSNEQVTYTAKDTTDNVVLTQTASVTFGTLSVSPGSSTMVATASPAEVNFGTSVTVTLLTSSGDPVAGKAVSLSGSPPTTVSISPDSSVTDQNGKATFSVDDSTAESVVFNATDVTDSQSITATATVAFQTPVASATASTITATPTTVAADGSSSSVISVTMRDQFGNALSGKAISLQLIDASTDAEAPPVAGSATPGTTDSSGTAEFGLVDTHAETVTVNATDTTDNVAVSGTATVTFTAGSADPGASTVTGSPTNSAGTVAVPSDGTTAATITVTLLDHGGSAVAGKNVTLTASGGNSAVTPSSATTSGTGEATFSVTDATAEVVTYMAKDTTDSLVLSATISVTFGSPPVPPPAVADSVLLAGATTAPADGSSTVTVTALLYDANGNAVTGKTVTLDLQGTGHAVVTPASAVTDQNGQANFSVTDATAETVTFTATDTTDDLPITGQSVMIAFTTASSAATTTTTTTSPGGSTTTTTAAPGGSTTTTAGSSVATSGTGGSQASTAADAGTVNAPSGQLALTGAPSLLPWLLGFGFVMLLGGSLGRRILRTGT